MHADLHVVVVSRCDLFRPRVLSIKADTLESIENVKLQNRYHPRGIKQRTFAVSL